MSQQCPCGCALQLAQVDLAAEARLGAIVGEWTGGSVLLSVPPSALRPSKSDPDLEQVPGICRGCRQHMTMPAYLVSFLMRQKAEWPVCWNCPSLPRRAT